MKENETKLLPFPLSGNGRLHVRKQSIEVLYQLIGLYPNCLGGGFIWSVDGNPLDFSELTHCRLQIGADLSLAVVVGRACDDRVPAVSFGLVDAETENEE